MIKFTIPAFVRCDNPQERKELIEWLEQIGYYVVNGAYITNYMPIFATKSGVVYFDSIDCFTYKPHDCGTNVALFKALDAMDDGFAKRMAQLRRNNELEKAEIEANYAEAAKLTGISQGNISMCCLGQRHSAGGYIWKYKNQKS